MTTDHEARMDAMADEIANEQETEATFGFIVVGGRLGAQLAWNLYEDAAIERAVAMLDDDPELRSLEVYEVNGRDWDYIADVVYGPGYNFEGEIVVLREGETLANPFGRTDAPMTEEEIRDVYSDDTGKREAMLRDLLG